MRCFEVNKLLFFVVFFISVSIYAEQTELVIDERDILAIDDEIKDKLDAYIRPLRLKEEKASQLHAYLFTPEGINIQYEAGETKTAQETYDTRTGNCVSLANLYVASARYLGLKAKYQNVIVPRTWEKGEEFYILPAHMNVVVTINSRTKAVVELVDTYVPLDLDDEIISDKRAFAEYYSNKGVEFLSAKDYGSAVSHLEKSIAVYDGLAFSWSNLGVAYKFNKDYEKAEKAYLKALDIDKKYLSALKNLYALYFDLNETDKVKSLSERVEKYAKRNPYFLARTAEILHSKGEYQGAVNLYKKAVGKKKDEGDFFFGLAKAYYQLGLTKKAEKARAKALNLAKDEEHRLRYESELEVNIQSITVQ